MLNPFILEYLQQPGFFMKLFKIPLQDNFRVELNNLLSGRHPHDINITELNQIRNKYQVYSEDKFNKTLFSLYNKALKLFLADRALSSDERIFLNSLRELLELEPLEVERMEKSILFEIYLNRGNNLLAETWHPTGIKTQLTKVASDLSLNSSIAEQFYYQFAKRNIQTKIIETLKDKRLTPDEESELKKLVDYYEIEMELDIGTEEELSQAKHLWNIENGKLTSIDVSINLHKEEVCYYTTTASTCEYRKIPQRINYSGMTSRIKLAKGLYWRMGSLALKPITKEALVQIESGKIYITNKRVIFSGKRTGSNTRLTSILDFALYENGITLRKDKGKNPIFLIEDIEHFSIVLAGVLEE
ncbi:MAG: hypothetical protein P9L91_09100 [Candidatus Zophobacter franzmannii]|nr:hypothetical protein [Candidatus Zophobacter franzmannii]